VTTGGAGTSGGPGAKAGISAKPVTGLRRFAKRPAGAPRPGAQPTSQPPAQPPASAGLPAVPTASTAPAAPAAVPGRQPAPDDFADPSGRLTLAGRVADVDAPPDAPPDVTAEADRCQLCNQVLEGRHGHLVDTDKRSLACTCRACYLLFTHQGAGKGGRYRAVPERIRHDPDRPLTDADWNELEIPVAMAFFFYNSALGRVVAGYPSPGGPTECELDLAAWDRLAAAYPLFGVMAPDVEAIFVNRTELGNEVFLIPIDMCYSLVGELRLRWQGFDGGSEVRAALATFLTGVRKRAEALEPRLADQDVER